MRKVVFEFANYAFAHELKHYNDHTQNDIPNFPFYDYFYQIINVEIEKLDVPKPILVSWLKGEDNAKAKLELENIPDISSIRNQFGNGDAKYPKINFYYFQSKELYHRGEIKKSK